MESNRAEAYVQKLKELNAYMASIISTIHQDVNRLEHARKENRKYFQQAIHPGTTATAVRLQGEALLLSWQNRLN